MHAKARFRPDVASVAVKRILRCTKRGPTNSHQIIGTLIRKPARSLRAHDLLFGILRQMLAVVVQKPKCIKLSQIR